MSARSERVSLVVYLAFLTAACGGPVDDAPVQGAATASLPLVTTVPAPPEAVLTTDERRHLVYEIVFRNFGATAVQMGRIDVVDAARRAPLARFEGAALAAVLLTNENDGTGTVRAGEGAVAFLDLALPARGPLPERLAHRITFTQDGSPVEGAGPTVAVVDRQPSRLAAPLHGSDIIDLNGCCNGAHTRALFTFDDGFFVAQRYAIDFVRVDVAAALAGGNPLFAGDPLRNESYFTFGAEIVAADGGRIADVRDGIPENTPTVLPPFDLDTASGNYVIEALDDGRFALYAHMQPGSLRVRVGDRVRRGQVLGLVGNTGHADLPHLHFHVMDRPSPLHANGVPYVLERFRLEATVDLSADDPAIDFVPPPQERDRRLPMQGDILALP